LLSKALRGAQSFSNGLAAIQYIDKKNSSYFINKKGIQIPHESIKDAKSFVNGRALVEVGHSEIGGTTLYNYLTLDGKYLLKDHIESHYEPPEFISPTITIFDDRNKATTYNWFGEDISNQ
ncbi:hypothetical protein MJH12_03095, partial [bacterium]|nr:hypothetical protein [bacterium]